MHINRQVFEGLQKIEGISGVSIIDDMGEVLHSTIKETEINELASFLSGISSILTSDKHLGLASKIILKSPKSEDLIVHLIDDKTIVSTLTHKASCAIASQKIELLLNGYTELQFINTQIGTPSPSNT